MTAKISCLIGTLAVSFLTLLPGDANAQYWRNGRWYGPRPYYGYYYPRVYYPPAYYVAPPVYYYSAPVYTYSAPAYTVYPTQVATTSVGTYDSYFSPRTIAVAPGTTVRWTNYGQKAHTVTSRDGQFDSGELLPGATFSRTFSTPGVYYYYCRHHTGQRMEGAIVVGQGTASY
jgi:plastocyanin